MLLPSVALGCDSRTRYQSSTSLLASPPLSPPTSSSSSNPTINNIYSTCRALQSMLSPPPQLPSPPMAHAESPFKLRLRARKVEEPATNNLTPRRKITKKTAPPPRGMNKRRRAEDDDMSRDTEDHIEEESEDESMKLSTPKRMRLAPETLPLGLERSDFHSLHLQQMEQSGEVLESIEKEPEEWSSEEDRMLVELVLEKLKLTKSEWQDCARSLGKDRGNVGRRWKTLMGAGDVGLKGRGPRRGKIHGTWR